MGKDFTELVKSIKGSTWDYDNKCWLMPMSRKTEFFEIIAPYCKSKGFRICDTP